MKLPLRTPLARATCLAVFLIVLSPAHSQQGSDVQMPPPAASVDDAIRTFRDRAAAAIAFNAGQALVDRDGAPLQHPLEAILGRLAYLDFFPNDKDTGLRMRQEAFQSILNQRVTSEVGTHVDEDFLGLKVAHRKGDYDFILTGYTLILHKYRDIMPAHVQDHLIDVLLNQHGKYDPFYQLLTIQIILLGNVLTPIPETENHVLMIYAARYLANQIRYKITRHPDYDNSRNGMNEFLLTLLSGYLKNDFIEYNSRPYQEFIMQALLNLQSFAEDPRVKQLARMVLDYISAKVAVSSNDARRAVPYRRTIKYYCPNLTQNVCGDDHGPDPQTAYYMMLSGVTDFLPTGAPLAFSGAFQRVGLSEYRLPRMVHHLFVNRAHRSFYQQFKHYSTEIYHGSPSYLISAGGAHTRAAYEVVLPEPLGTRYKNDDLGMVLPTTLMLTGTGNSIVDLIRFESDMTWFQNEGVIQSAPPTRVINNLGVAPNFACGLYPIVPGPEPVDFAAPTADGGAWGFFNFRRPSFFNPSFGCYVALYTNSYVAPSGFSQHLIPFGFLEVFDTYLNPEVQFRDFAKGVLDRNGNKRYGAGRNVYLTAAGDLIEFDFSALGFGASIIAINGVAAGPNTSGTIINNDRAGVITIDNPALRQRLWLDVRDPSNPRRIEDFIGGPEVWVDFGFRGRELGTYAEPFNTLDEAVERVPHGGTVKILPGSRPGPFPTISKSITFVAPLGGVTIGR